MAEKKNKGKDQGKIKRDQSEQRRRSKREKAPRTNKPGTGFAEGRTRREAVDATNKQLQSIYDYWKSKNLPDEQIRKIMDEAKRAMEEN